MYKKILFPALILAFALVGCKTTGIKKSEKAVQSMQAKYLLLKSTPEKITAVTDSLDQLIAEGGDIRTEFKAFEKNINSLMSNRDPLDKLNAKIESSKKAFTRAWQERQLTIKDDEMRNRSRKRYAEVIAQFNEVDRLAAQANMEFNLWMQRVLDIRTYLESDLNPRGIASIADIASEISADAELVKRKITPVITKLDAVIGTMAVPKQKASKSKKNKKSK